MDANSKCALCCWVQEQVQQNEQAVLNLRCSLSLCQHSLKRYCSASQNKLQAHFCQMFFQIQ